VLQLSKSTVPLRPSPASEPVIEFRRLASARSRADLLEESVKWNSKPGNHGIPLSPAQWQHTINLVVSTIGARRPMSHDIASDFPSSTSRTSSTRPLLPSPFRNWLRRSFWNSSWALRRRHRKGGTDFHKQRREIEILVHIFMRMMHLYLNS